MSLFTFLHLPLSSKVRKEGTESLPFSLYQKLAEMPDILVTIKTLE